MEEEPAPVWLAAAADGVSLSLGRIVVLGLKFFFLRLMSQSPGLFGLFRLSGFLGLFGLAGLNQINQINQKDQTN
jgi:hypothetical protein